MRALLWAIALCLPALPVWADARVTILMDAMRSSDLVQIIRREGLRDAQIINEDMLAGQGGAFWQAQVDGLYSAQKTEDVLYDALRRGLNDDDLEMAVRFFDSLQGQRIVDLEIAARSAMADPDVTDVASEGSTNRTTDEDPHAALIAQFAQSIDLLELNVAVALSTRYRFYLGLAEGGFLRQAESDIVADIWALEDHVREEAQHWLSAYLALAYQPLDIVDLQAYVSFYQSSPGQALNAALSSGFEIAFKDIAYGLGRAVALNAVGNDI